MCVEPECCEVRNDNKVGNAGTDVCITLSQSSQKPSQIIRNQPTTLLAFVSLIWDRTGAAAGKIEATGPQSPELL